MRPNANLSLERNKFYPRREQPLIPLHRCQDNNFIDPYQQVPCIEGDFADSTSDSRWQDLLSKQHPSTYCRRLRNREEQRVWDRKMRNLSLLVAADVNDKWGVGKF